MKKAKLSLRLVTTALCGAAVLYGWQSFEKTSAETLSYLSSDVIDYPRLRARAEINPAPRATAALVRDLARDNVSGELPQLRQLSALEPFSPTPGFQTATGVLARIEAGAGDTTDVLRHGLPSENRERRGDIRLQQPAADKAWVRVRGSQVNLRSSPGTDSGRIGSFRRGMRLKVLEEKASWSRVENPSTGQTGWMHRDFLAKTSAG